MVTIVELIEVVLSGMLSLISPEKTADKVNDTNTSKSAKRISIVLFTLIYVAALVGIIFSLVLITDVIYKVFASMLIIFILYCISIFYKRILTSK